MSTSRYTLPRIPVETKKLPRAERRASILRGAAAAFAHGGFAPTSMDDVAAACGVTKMIVYRHFETKEDLYRAVLQRVFDRLLEELEAGQQAGEIRGLGGRIHLVVAREEPNGYRLLWRHAAREPKFADYAAEGRASSVALLRRLVRLDSGDDTFDQWTAEVMLTWLVESTLAWLDHGDPTRDGEYLDRTGDAFRALRDTWSLRTSHNG